jgi:hypothetical protein
MLIELHAPVFLFHGKTLSQFHLEISINWRSSLGCQLQIFSNLLEVPIQDLK